MNALHLVGAGAAIAAACWLVSVDRSTPPATPATAPAAAVADGHYVLVVEGTRSALAITRAVHKADPWAGTPKGLQSDWLLRIDGPAGERLAELPLDLSAFAVGAAEQGQGVRVEGCTVRDERVGMLASVPAFPNAARYSFTRSGAVGERVEVGSLDGETVRRLAGGGR